MHELWRWSGVKNKLDEKINEGLLRWFAHVERMENETIA